MFGKRISNLLGKITILVVICCCCLPAHAKYGGGKGEPNDPYQIADANDLLELGTTTDDYDKHFILIADVNMVGYTFTTAVIAADTNNTNDDFDGIPFTGVFDGAGHRILNLTIDTATGDNDFLGLFGFISSENAQVKNLGLENVSIIGGDDSDFLGGLCGKNDGGTISNCYATGSVTGGVYSGYLGGLCGDNYEGTISNCYSTGSVSGNSRVGGLVGYNRYGTITNCYSIGSVGGYVYVGGLMGGNVGTITNCYVAGSVSGSYLVSGLVGINSATIKNCYSTGSVAGTRGVGGLVGSNVGGGKITGCGSSTSVLGDERVGGLVGDNRRIIRDSYATSDVGGNRYVGGLAGRNYERDREGVARIYTSYSTGSVTGNFYIGGLVGVNDGTVYDCYSIGQVAGNTYVGGLAGQNGHYDCAGWGCFYFPGTIAKCYSAGIATGIERVGGLVGYNKDGYIKKSYWDIETSGLTTSAGGTGLPTAEMQMQVTFIDSDWDFVGETTNGIKDNWFIPYGDYPHLWWEGMQVPMKLTPRTLNCRSEGNWVKAHITLPQGFTLADVNSNRPAVLHSFGFQSAPLYVFVNKDKVVEIEAAFEREAVCSLAGDWPDALTVAGFLADGNIFLGTSTVRIIHPGMKVIEELASCWLQEDCIYPETDMNRDSLVNLLDYALLMNINVEFVTDE